MANSYLKTAFAIIVAAAEAELVLAAQTTAHALYDDEIDETSARVAHFQSLGDAFARAFPPTGDDPFSGFLALFDDADYPSFGGDFEISPFQNDPERRELYFGGEQVELDAVARLLRLAAPSALPFGFEYALDCDRLRPDWFGGGYVAVTAQGLICGGSARGLEHALSRADGDDADGLVLTTRDAEHGLLFWSNDDGFGALSRASIFSRTEANAFDIPIADDEPEWLAMPAPVWPRLAQ